MKLDEAVYQLALNMPEAFGEPVNGDYAVKEMTMPGSHGGSRAVALHTIDHSGQRWQIAVRPVERVRSRNRTRG